ncbi:MAG TPA: AAA family ATPase [Micromonosporaceae bacterium]|nr:AAA family ATPase [Micromonosporaceae bacterium]
MIITHDDLTRMLRVLRTRSGKSLRMLEQLLRKQDEKAAPRSSTLAAWFAGDHLPTPGLVPGFTALLRILGVTHHDVDLWLDALERVRSLPGPRPASASAPYRGLAPYEPEHAAYFAGRDALVAELVSKLGAAESAGQPLVVVGPSGSGKSSLLRAGLVPAVCGTLQGESLRSYLLLVPTGEPVADLAAALAAVSGRPATEITATLREDPFACRHLVAQALVGRSAQDQLLVVVDQFEQLFTNCPDPSERSIFVAALCAAATSRTRVVLGMRSDFYTRALELPQLVPALQTSQLVVGPMSEDELRQAIGQPAAHANLKLQPGLVELLLQDLAPTRSHPPKDTAHEAGALPLLSHALLSTWKYAKGKTLTIEHYRAVGGITGAVARTAETAYGELDSPRQQETARRIFMRLVQTNDDTVHTRRRVPITELLDIEPGPDGGGAQAVLDQFIVARLLTIDKDRVEIAHEALLTAWPRLVEWLDNDQGWRGVHRRLQLAARQWQEADRSTDNLYRGRVLQATREWVETRGYAPELNRLERDFIEASFDLHMRELQQAHRQRRRRQQILAGLTALMLVATGGVGYALQLQIAREREQEIAATARDQALSRLVAGKADRLRERDPGLAMQLALSAYRIHQTPEARSSLLNSTASPTATRLRPTQGQARSVTSSKDGKLVAAGTNEGTVELWDLAGTRPTRAGILSAAAATSLVSVAFSPDGRLLVAGGKNRMAYLWKLNDPTAAPRTLTGFSSEAVAVAFSSDSRTLAASNANTVRMWNVIDPDRVAAPVVLTGPTETVRSLAFTPDGRTLAAGSNDSSVYLWRVGDRASANPINVLTEPTSRVFSVAISPDGRMLAAGTGAEHLVYLWDITNPGRPRLSGAPLAGPASWVNSVSFHPNGSTLAVGSSDTVLWTYDLRTRRSTSQLPHPNPVTGGIYRSDGVLATVSTDGLVRLWAMPGPAISGAADSVFTVAFDAVGNKLGVAAGAADNSVTFWNTADHSRPVPERPVLTNSDGSDPLSGAGAITPDGRIFVAGDTDGHVHLWDISPPGHSVRAAVPVSVADDLIESIAVRPDGKLLAASSDDGTVGMVDISDPARPVVRAKLKSPEPGLIYQAAFHPTGLQLAVASANQNVYLWDVANPDQPTLQTALQGFTAAAYSVAYSHDGKVLAAGSADNTVRVWDVSNLRAPQAVGRPLTGPVGYIYSVAFRTDRRVLATGSTDNTIWLWDLTDHRQPTHLATLTGATKGVLTVAFKPTDDHLAAGGHDRTVRLWNTEPEAAASWVCATAGETVTQREWELYIPDRPYTPPCG